MPSQWLDRFLDIGAEAGDSRDDRVQKRLQVAMAASSIPAIGLWGLSFVAAGHPEVARWHLAYIAVTATLLSIVTFSGRFAFLRAPHPAIVLLLPFGLHWQLGGFQGSGGAMLWCLLGPVAAMMFLGPRRSLPYFAAVLALTVVGAFRESAGIAPILTPGQMSLQFAVNTGGFAAFLFLSTRHFVSRIDEEKARSDRLLENILPVPIAERLKHQEGTIAERFEGVTVLFSDIVGFTQLSARLPADELVHLLDEIFSGFDSIADRHGLEKIKTIGDAYMAVGGLPVPAADHAVRVVRAALEMDRFLREFAANRNLTLAMRIGVHSGEVVAGVIGKRKFSYDLWGDTVNTASRMESHGAPGRVHVSEATQALLGSAFESVDRGMIAVKGKGDMRTFFVGEPPAQKAA